MQILTFQVEQLRCGAPVSNVVQVLRAVTVTRLPKAPFVIAGVINVRGEIVPVLDVRARFGLPPKALDPADNLILVRAGQRLVALHVDPMIDLLPVDEECISDVKAIVPRSDYVAGIAKLADGLVLIHDLEAFLSQAESEQLDRALNEGIEP